MRHDHLVEYVDGLGQILGFQQCLGDGLEGGVHLGLAAPQDDPQPIMRLTQSRPGVLRRFVHSSPSWPTIASRAIISLHSLVGAIPS